jgi:hypothetical protein
MTTSRTARRTVDPQIRPFPLDRPGQEGVHPLVDFLDEATDLALRNTRCPHGLDQIVDGPGGHAVDVGFLDDGGQGFFGGPPRLEEGGEVASLAQPGDFQIDPARASVPAALAIAMSCGRRGNVGSEV